MTSPAITLQTESAAAVVVEDADLVRFLLSQPDPQAALRDSLRRGVQSLRLASEPWPDRDAGAFRNMGAVS